MVHVERLGGDAQLEAAGPRGDFGDYDAEEEDQAVWKMTGGMK